MSESVNYSHLEVSEYEFGKTEVGILLSVGGGGGGWTLPILTADIVVQCFSEYKSLSITTLRFILHWSPTVHLQR